MPKITMRQFWKARRGALRPAPLTDQELSDLALAVTAFIVKTNDFKRDAEAHGEWDRVRDLDAQVWRFRDLFDRLQEFKRAQKGDK